MLCCSTEFQVPKRSPPLPFWASHIARLAAGVFFPFRQWKEHPLHDAVEGMFKLCLHCMLLNGTETAVCGKLDCLKYVLRF